MNAFRKIFVIVAALAPGKLFACAACYANGASINDPMAAGMNWAIFTLGVVVATVLGTFLAFLIYAIRKSEAVEAARQSAAAVGNPSPVSRCAATAGGLPPAKTHNPQFA